MKELCKNAHHEKAVGAARDTRPSSLQGLSIKPPPKETEPERLYRVVYVIDINAMNPRQAAERAYEIMKDPQSIQPVLDIIDSVGRQTRVDLSDV
jgi:hypothetical protein